MTGDHVCDCGMVMLGPGQSQEVIPVIGKGEEVHREQGGGFSVCYRADGERIEWYTPVRHATFETEGPL